MKLALSLVVLSLLTVPCAVAQSGQCPNDFVSPLVGPDAQIPPVDPTADESWGSESEVSLVPVAPVPQSCTTIHYSCNGWYANGECCADGRKQLQKVCYRCYECTSSDEPWCDIIFNFSCNGGWC